jgi:prophage regulatory protein
LTTSKKLLATSAPWANPDQTHWPDAAKGPPEIWRLDRTMAATGLSRTVIYRAVAEGRFPRPLKLNERGHAIGWLSTEVMAFIFSRVRARDEARETTAA